MIIEIVVIVRKYEYLITLIIRLKSIVHYFFNYKYKAAFSMDYSYRWFMVNR